MVKTTFCVNVPKVVNILFVLATFALITILLATAIAYISRPITSVAENKQYHPQNYTSSCRMAILVALDLNQYCRLRIGACWFI